MGFLDQLSPTDRALFEQQDVDINLLDDSPDSPLLPGPVSTVPNLESAVPEKPERKTVVPVEPPDGIATFQDVINELTAAAKPKAKRGTSTKKTVRVQASSPDDEFTERINLHVTASMYGQINNYTSQVLRRIPRIRKSLQPEVVRALLALILSDPQRCEAAMLDIIKRYKQAL